MENLNELLENRPILNLCHDDELSLYFLMNMVNEFCGVNCFMRTDEELSTAFKTVLRRLEYHAFGRAVNDVEDFVVVAYGDRA